MTVTYTPSNQVATGTSSPASTSDAGTLTLESDSSSGPYVLALTGQAGPVAVSSPANLVPLATFTLSQNSLTFPTTSVGDLSSPQAILLTNTGNVTLHVTSLQTTSDFTAKSTCATVAPAASCTVTITSTPQATGAHIAALQIASNFSTSLEFVSLSSAATAPPLTFNPLALDFGPLLLGKTATLPVQVTNTTTSAVTFTSLSAAGDYAVAGACPPTGSQLAPAASCTLQVTFTPTSAGVRPGTLSLATSATVLPLTVPLTGIGLQSTLAVSTNALSFGNVVLGSPANLTLTITNTGSTTISGLTAAASGDYLVTIPCASATLTAGASCVMQITFSPTATGVRSGTLTIASSDPASPSTIPLSGTGVPAGSFTLTVDGGTSSSASLISGQPATFHLALTSTGGFSGAVALTCAPVVPAQYAACSLQPSTLTLASGVTQTAVAVINTITSTGGTARLATPRPTLSPVFACFLIPSIFVVWKERRLLRGRLPVLLSLLFTAISLVALGCGGGSPSTNVLYTPAGTYQFTVTATSTSGIQTTQTVTLNLTVAAR